MDDLIPLSSLLVAVGSLTAVTNVIAQVLKQVTWDKLPTNLLVVLIAQALTLATGGAYAQISGITVLWYHVVGAVVVGLGVAYAAMFGYDKLKEALDWQQKQN